MNEDFEFTAEDVKDAIQSMVHDGEIALEQLQRLGTEFDNLGSKVKVHRELTRRLWNLTGAFAEFSDLLDELEGLALDNITVSAIVLKIEGEKAYDKTPILVRHISSEHRSGDI